MKRLSTTSLAVVVSTFLFVLISTLLFLTTARADSWSWTNADPTVVSNDEASRDMEWNNICAAKYQGGSKHSRKIEGQYNQYPEYFTDCLLAEGNNFQLFTRGNSLSVSFAGESHAHAIRGVECVSYACIYMPSRDYLITTINARGIGGTQVLVYKNFVRNLQRQTILYPNLQTETAFTARPDPDRVLTAQFDSGSYTATTVWMQRSMNDRWLVFEIVGMGIFRMDMSTQQTIKVVNFRTNYWYAGPNIDFDITDDGQHIAIFGFNSLNAVYEIVPGCGSILPEHPSQIQLNDPLANAECPYLSLPALFSDPRSGIHMPSFGSAYQPEFSDDGGEISFYTMPYQGSSDPPRHITLRASGYSGPRPLDYLALGDSYSSGEGDTENDSHGSRFYRKFTNTLGNSAEPKERCHISTRSYPYILAQGMNLSLNSEWNTVACSGATAWDVKAQGSYDYAGQNDRLKGFNVEALKYQSLNEFIPGRQKQIEFVRKYKPKVITLTMGGNDIGFADKVGSCAGLPSICDLVTTNRGRLAQEIRDQYDNLKSLYEDLYRASDSMSKIYVIGYPSFINGDIDAKCETQIGFLTHEEREMISNSITYMNNTIHAASAAVGVEYIDIEHSLLGHRLCDSGDRYVTAVTDGLNWNHYKQESYHPNAKGNHEIAMAIWDRLDHVSLIDYNICRVSIGNICPDTESTKASIVTPDYFLSESLIKKVKYKQMTDTEQNINTPLDIALPNYSFQSDSSVTVTLHSDPTYLGTFTAGAYGQLNLAAVIPNSIPFGYHTLIISGIDYTGASVEYEQIIFFENTNTLSTDGHGKIDTQDKQASYYPSSTGVGHGGNNNQGDTKIHDSASTRPGISGNQPFNNHGEPRARQHLFANLIEHIIKIYLYLVLKTILLLYIR